MNPHRQRLAPEAVVEYLLLGRRCRNCTHRAAMVGQGTCAPLALYESRGRETWWIWATEGVCQEWAPDGSPAALRAAMSGALDEDEREP